MSRRSDQRFLRQKPKHPTDECRAFLHVMIWCFVTTIMKGHTGGVTHSASLQRVEDERGVRVVVVEADEEIWIANELMTLAVDPQRARVDGDFNVDGDVITFGTPGEGLGRLVYRVVEQGEYWHIARREG